ncbi:MAG: rhomboid family intramembrane serine protease [Treponema sp.]|nr:rhomboid family intramembrane serine protease [Treponema sp.]
MPLRYRYSNAVLILIVINILVFVAGRFLGQRFIAGYMAMIPAAVMQGWVWTFITYMFVHGGIGHIFFNMFALFIFGTRVEQRMGTLEFLLFYFISGVLAGIFSFAVYVLTGSYYVALMGASGAIYAVQLAYAVFYPDSYIYIWGILPLRTPVAVLGFTALEIISAVAGLNNKVAHFTHLAGFAVAWVYLALRYRISPWKELTGR